MYYKNLKDILSGKLLTEIQVFTSLLYVLQTKRIGPGENRKKGKYRLCIEMPRLIKYKFTFQLFQHTPCE
jgi:hypothetical protein